MKIRSEQMAAFSQAAVRGFEDRMVAHVREFFPGRCESLGEEKTRETIRYGIARAEAYNIVVERDVCKYIDVMFAYGRDFDTNPKLPWAGAILNDPAVTCPTTRANRVFEAATDSARRQEDSATGGRS